MLNLEPAVLRMALLLHTLVDGTSHVDWLIEGPQRIPAPPSPEDRCLITFRMPARMDEPPLANFEAERIEDHRRLYLDFEGPVAGDRGTVTRLTVGVVEHLEVNARTMTVSGRFGAGAEVIWRGTGVGLAWVFEAT